MHGFLMTDIKPKVAQAKILSEHRHHNLFFPFKPKLARKRRKKKLQKKWERRRGNIRRREISSLKVILNNFFVKERHFVHFICWRINYADFFKCKDYRNPFLPSFIQHYGMPVMC